MKLIVSGKQFNVRECDAKDVVNLVSSDFSWEGDDVNRFSGGLRETEIMFQVDAAGERDFGVSDVSITRMTVEENGEKFAFDGLVHEVKCIGDIAEVSVMVLGKIERVGKASCES